MLPSRKNNPSARRGYTLSGLLLFIALCGLILAAVMLIHRTVSASGVIISPAVSLDGSTVAAAFMDGTVRVWDLGKGKQVGKIDLQAVGYPLDMTLSSNGAKLTVAVSGAVTLWDVRSGQHLAGRFSPHWMRGGLSPDGEWSLAVDPATNLLEIRSVVDGALRLTLSDPRAAGVDFFTSAFSPDGRWLATWSIDADQVFLWDLSSGQVHDVWDADMAAFTGHGQAVTMAHSQTVSPVECRFCVRDLESESVHEHGIVNDRVIEAQIASADGKLLALHTNSGIDVWNIETGHRHGRIEVPHVSTMTAVPKTNQLLLAAGDRITLWDANTLRPLGDLWSSETGYSYAAIVAGFFLWFIVWGARQARKQRVSCHICGLACAPPKKGKPAICIHCQAAMQSVAQGRWPFARSFIILVVSWAILSLILSWLAELLFATPPWPIFVGLCLGPPALLVLGVLLRSKVRARRVRNEELDFNTARRYSGGEGCVVRIGNVVAWLADETTLKQRLPDVLERTRQRVADLTGLPAAFDRPLRIVCFERRQHYDRFLRAHGAGFGQFAGVYLQAPMNKIVLSEQGARRQLSQPAELLASTLAHYFLESWPALKQQVWLGAGLAHWLACADVPEAASRLRRQLRAAEHAGTILGTELFDVSLETRYQRATRWLNHEDATFTSLFGAQAASLLEYLAGTDAVPACRTAFQATIQSLEANTRFAEAFPRHAGYSLDTLLANWRQWLDCQPLGEPPQPPPHHRETLENELIPLIGDWQALPKDRMLAIRALRSGGYLLGADALIALLGPPTEPLLREAALAALRSISGHTHREAEAWQSWYESAESSEGSDTGKTLVHVNVV